jgi:raffinose/stachyose/melibiose transport system substrate-binding protein
MKISKSFLFIIIIAAMIMSACASAAPKTSAPASGDTSGNSDKVELVYWSMWTEQEAAAKVIQKMMDEYTAQNPNVTFKTVWNGRENQTKLRSALAAGTKVDLMDQDTDQVAGGMMSEGLGYPLDSLLTQDVKDLFSPGILDQYKSRDGHVFLWPYVNNAIVFHYNKDVFANAGIDKAPETWDEFLAACDKLKAAGIAPIVTEYDQADFTGYWFNYLVERQKGPGFLLKTIEDKTGEMWKDPVYANSIKLAQELWTRGCFPPEVAGYLWPAAQQTIATEKSGMELIGSWLPNEVKDVTGPDFKWGQFAFPTIPGGQGKITDLELWTEAFMILKDSEHPKEAFDFLKFVMSKENQTMMTNESGSAVTGKDIVWEAKLADAQKIGDTATDVLMHFDGGVAYHANFVKNVLNLNLVPAFFNKMTPEDFSSKMAEAAKTYWETNDK